MMANKACVGIGVCQGGGQGIKGIDFDKTPGNLLVPVFSMRETKQSFFCINYIIVYL